MNSADTLVKMMNSMFTMDQQTDIGPQALGNRRFFYHDIHCRKNYRNKAHC